MPLPEDMTEAERDRLRDEFAKAALAGELAAQSAETGEYSNVASIRILAENSYAIADAMMEARDRGRG